MPRCFLFVLALAPIWLIGCSDRPMRVGVSFFGADLYVELAPSTPRAPEPTPLADPLREEDKDKLPGDGSRPGSGAYERRPSRPFLELQDLHRTCNRPLM